MDPIIIQYYKSPFGEMIIGSFKEKLCLSDWRYRNQRNLIDKRITSGLNAEYFEGNSEFNHEVIHQLHEYFTGKRKEFNIPLQPVGSPFQVSIWNELLKIQYGKTKTYHELSLIHGNEKAIRAIAAANAANSISIIIPCHRVLGSRGELTGYAGGINVKKRLLQLEKAAGFNQLELF